MGSFGRQAPGPQSTTLYPIDEKDAAMARTPQFIAFEPDAAIGALATGQVEVRVSWMDFVATKVGFTSPTVGFPAGPGRWKIQVVDVGASRNWQPEGWDISAVTGANAGVSDATPLDLPVPWVFMEKTTIRVIFEELAGFDNLPHLVLIGYLTNWKREATAAQVREELQMEALKRQADLDRRTM